MTPAQIYNGGVETGGVCPCTTPPTPIDCAASASRTVRVNNLAPVVMNDSMSPASGATCTSPPSGCVSTRMVIATSTKVFVQGQPVAKIGDILNGGTNIRLSGATQSANVNFG
jgi:uncharacterized Zn-binding protein involved in type VI secretion